MTHDVIALTPAMPDAKTVVAGLLAGGPDLEVRTLAEGAVVQLCAPDGRTLVSVEAPVLVHTPGEAQRLLGVDVSVPDGPFWWTEARASLAVEEAERLAGSFAGRLATVLGGSVWPPGAAHTDVVTVAPDGPLGEAPGPAVTPPAVDALTDEAAVVIQDRPVIAMSTWLSDALREATAADRALQIVTPPHTRLTLPARLALQGHPNRWVVQHPDHGYYDGLSGAELDWRDGAFGPIRDDDGTVRLAEAFRPAPDAGERQLILGIRTRHDPDEDLVLGGALDTAFRHLTGAPPAGLSTAEPVNLPWSPRQLTALARRRAPRPTWLMAVGGPARPTRPALATLDVTRTRAGVEEDITLAVGHGAQDPPPAAEDIARLAEALAAEHGLVSLLTSLRSARRDLTVPARWEAPPVPLAFTLGPDAVRDIGLTRAQRPPLDVAPARLGPAAAPALHYPLGDGRDPAAWDALRVLTGHLKGE
ncbi:DUF6177 family protein [Streptomyces sp. G45]|uniref:DUF6177 family protein n=1 Tax=Streptomyces sp. G45 TaxID=3406627 RepID=UPI003C2624FE